MKVKLKIEYEVNAEEGETQAEEDRTMEFVGGAVNGFVEGLTAEAKAAGLDVKVGAS
jgi:hypothetical protein